MAKKIDKGVMTAEERKKITDGLKQWWASRATPEHRESARKRFSKPKSEEHLRNRLVGIITETKQLPIVK